MLVLASRLNSVTIGACGFEFERTFNGSYGRDWELNAGMTWRFH